MKSLTSTNPRRKIAKLLLALPLLGALAFITSSVQAQDTTSTPPAAAPTTPAATPVHHHHHHRHHHHHHHYDSGVKPANGTDDTAINKHS